MKCINAFIRGLGGGGIHHQIPILRLMILRYSIATETVSMTIQYYYIITVIYIYIYRLPGTI